MAVTPGPTITRASSRGSDLSTVATDTLFAIGLADRGSVVGPERIEGMADYATKLGLRTGANGDDNSTLYDALDGYFALGGRVAYVQRYVGPAAVIASITMLDGSSGTVATVRAANPGAWGNTLTYTVQTNNEDATIPSGSFVVIVYLSGVEVERSPILGSKTALLQWAPAVAKSGTSQYLALTSGASANIPAAVVARALASGAGDRASATSTQWSAALDLLSADLGPGQVTFPGATTSAAHALVQAHADSHNRVALTDAPDSATTATVTGVAAVDRAATGQKGATAFWPWVVIPGITQGTTRTISPSVVAAALMARSDNLGNSPNVPAAGANGRIDDYAVGLSQVAVSDAVRGTLNEAGVAVFRDMGPRGIRLYGYRTLADPLADPNFIGLNNARMLCLLQARLDDVAEEFEFSETDPATVANFANSLLSALGEYWPDGGLFGDTFSEAAQVSTAINTPAYLASFRMGATAYVRLDRFAERIPITVVSVSPAEVL